MMTTFMGRWFSTGASFRVKGSAPLALAIDPMFGDVSDNAVGWRKFNGSGELRRGYKNANAE